MGKEINWCDLPPTISPNIYSGDANWHWVRFGIVDGKPIMVMGCRKGGNPQVTVEKIAGRSKAKIVVSSINEGKREAYKLIT